MPFRRSTRGRPRVPSKTAGPAKPGAVPWPREVPGVSILTAHTLLAEVGPDLSRFRSASAFASWLGLCPDNDITGGKKVAVGTRHVDNRAAWAVQMAANALRKCADRAAETAEYARELEQDGRNSRGLPERWRCMPSSNEGRRDLVNWNPIANHRIAGYGRIRSVPSRQAAVPLCSAPYQAGRAGLWCSTPSGRECSRHKGLPIRCVFQQSAKGELNRATK